MMTSARLTPGPECTDTVTVPIPQVYSLTTDKVYVDYTDNDSSGTITAGDDLNYTVTMTNTGTTTLTNVVVSDPDLTPTSQTCASVLPGGTCVLTGSYTVLQSDVDAGSFVNVATVTDDDVCTVTPGPECTDTVTVPIPQVYSLTTDKVYVDYTDNDISGTITAGDDLNYTVTMTNTGTTTLTNVVVSDPELTPTSQTCASVLPGGTCVLTGSYTVLQSDVDAGSFVNVATVTDDDVCTATPGPECTDTVTVPIPQVYTLTTDKVYVDYTDNDISGTITAGDDLNYTVTMTNTGTTTLTNVVVSDPELTPTSQTCASVLPGGTCVLTGSYTVLQSDVDAGSFVNVATVTDDDVCTAAPYPVA